MTSDKLDMEKLAFFVSIIKLSLNYKATKNSRVIRNYKKWRKCLRVTLSYSVVSNEHYIDLKHRIQNILARYKISNFMSTRAKVCSIIKKRTLSNIQF